MSAEQALDRLLASGLLACLPLERAVDELLEVGDALLATPVPAVALGAGAGVSAAAVAEFRARFGRNLLVGAWRVRTAAECRLMLAAGAQVVVGAPAADLALLCREADVLYLPVLPALPPNPGKAEACALALPAWAMTLAVHVAAPLLLTNAGTNDDVVAAATLRRARAHAGHATVLALAPPLLDLHATLHAFITHLRRVRALWETGPPPVEAP